eukprot:TCONS_00055483-protein
MANLTTRHLCLAILTTFSMLTTKFEGCECRSISSWLKDSDYPEVDQKTFGQGSFTLGVPAGHSCAEKNFQVPGGRLICTKTKTNDVMCIPSCKKDLFLRTDYDSHKSVIAKFPIFLCKSGSLFWTDIQNNRLSLPNPRCVKKDDFLNEILEDKE